MARISNYGLEAPQSGSGVAAQSGSKTAEPRRDPVEMLQYAKDAGTRNVESMGQIGASWFDGIPQVYDDDQIAAAKSAISRAQTPEEVTQIVQGLAGQNHGGNVGPINNALGQMGVGYSSDAGFSDIGRGIRSMTGTLDRVDVPAEDDYERALQWLGNAIPNAAAISDFAIPLPSGAASTVHLYKGAKALPGKVAGGVKAAPGKVADWYKGRYNAYSDRLAGKKPAAPAGETAQTGGRAAETAETAAPAAERTAAPAAERTAASETVAPAAERTAAPAAERTAASETAAPAAERTAASETTADGGVSELANAGNAGREAAAGGQAAGAGRAGEQASGTILASRRSYIDGLADYINGQSKAFGTADRANISKWLTDGYPDLNDAELSYILDKVFAARTVP